MKQLTEMTHNVSGAEVESQVSLSSQPYQLIVGEILGVEAGDFF